MTDNVMDFIKSPERKIIFAAVEEQAGSFTTNDIVNAIQFQSIVITVSTVQKTLQGLARHRYLVTHTRKLAAGRGRPVMYFHKAEPGIK